MTDAKDEFRDFFKSLGKLEGLDESDLLEMGSYLDVDQEITNEIKAKSDPSFQLMSEFLTSLRGLGNLSEEELLEIIKYSGDDEPIPEVLIKEQEEEADEKKINDVRVLLSKMKLPQKVKMAMFGNATCRAILIGNGNRLIQLSVLKNPKIQEKEILEYSHNTNMSKAVLRAISDNRLWMASYGMKLNLVCNPKCPLDVATKWLRFINSPDLKKIARSKNIPGTVVTLAKKKLESLEKKK